MMKRSILLLLSLSCTCLQASVSSDAVGATARRSVVSPQPASAPFGKATFAGNNKYFLGASTPTANNKEALACAKLARANGVWTVPFTALAGQASVNGAAVAVSPLQGQQITNMALLGTDQTTNGRLPVVTDAAAQKVYLVAQPLDGSDLRSSGVLKDSANADVSSIVGVAATAEEDVTLNGIFAAVAPNAGTWDGGVNNRGVVLLSVDADPANGLTPTNARAVNLNVTALLANLNGTQPVAFKSAGGINNAVLGNGVDVVWDQKLQRFYMGFNSITRNANNLIGGVVSVVVGKYNAAGNNVEYLPLFNPTVDPATFFTNNTPNGIIGFRYDAVGTKPAVASAYKVRVMHTSTGRSYLIVNGGVIDDAAEINMAKPLVYALPLLDGPGQLAQVDAADPKHEFEAVTGPNMKKSDAVDAVVGASADALCHDLTNNDHQVTINDMQVVGDTVYVSVAGTRDATNKEEQGIFASSAIFDQYGVIRAWTPWQRVMGSIEAVPLFAFDEKGSNYWFTDFSSLFMKVTRWDAGATNIHTDAAHLLSTVLQPAFADNLQGGVYGLFNFDDQTLGFKKYDPATDYPQFSMMVATGYNRVAMIQTGAVDADGIFQQTKSFDATVAAATQNVFVFDETKLPDLGSITTAEVARVAPSTADGWDKGWFFVGGERGVAALRYSVAGSDAGSGWANGNGEGLAQLKGAVAGDYPGGANFAFKQIAFYADQVTPLNITNVRKIVSDGKYLYILTNNALSRLTMTADTMFNGYLADDNDYQIPLDISIDDQVVSKAGSDAEAFTLVHDQDEFFDMMLVQKTATVAVLVIATSKGLVKITVTNAGLRTQIRTVLVYSTQADFATQSLGPVLHLDFVSQLRGGQRDDDGNAQGNLYALAMDVNGQALNTYRFDVNGANVHYFTESYQVGSTPTDYFYQIGSLAKLAPYEFSGLLDFVTYTRHVGDLATYFVDNMPVVPSTDMFLQTDPIKLNTDLSYWPHMGTKVFDTASGAVYVPGQYGVRVNE